MKGIRIQSEVIPVVILAMLLLTEFEQRGIKLVANCFSFPFICLQDSVKVNGKFSHCDPNKHVSPFKHFSHFEHHSGSTIVKTAPTLYTSICFDFISNEKPSESSKAWTKWRLNLETKHIINILIWNLITCIRFSVQSHFGRVH